MKHYIGLLVTDRESECTPFLSVGKVETNAICQSYDMFTFKLMS
jgi:hypothetical protein